MMNRQDETIYGEKTFEHDVTFKGDVQINGALSGAGISPFVGRKFYVHATRGSDGGGAAHGTIDSPFASLEYAISNDIVRADRGDVIIAMPGHAETLSSELTMDIAGVAMIGLGFGRNYPVLTPSFASDSIAIDGARCLLSGFNFAVPGVDGQNAIINVGAAADCAITNCIMQGSTTAINVDSFITVEAGAHRLLLQDLELYNSTVEVPIGISLEGISTGVVIRRVNILDLIGFTTGALADGAALTMLKVENCCFQNAKAATAVITFSNNSSGVCRWCHIIGRHTTIASNVVTGTSMNFFENRVVEEATLNGMIMPASDAD